MRQHRYHVRPERAETTLRDTSAALSALFALQAHMDHHHAWMSRASMALTGKPRRDDDRAKDARAVATAHTDRSEALPRDLAELAAHAEAALPDGARRSDEILETPQLPRLPDRIGPVELRAFEKSYVTGMAAQMRAATAPLRGLRDDLCTWDDHDSRDLAERMHDFIADVHGPERA